MKWSLSFKWIWQIDENITVDWFCFYWVTLIWAELPYFFVLTIVLFSIFVMFFLIFVREKVCLVMNILCNLILRVFYILRDARLNCLLILSIILYFCFVLFVWLILLIFSVIGCIFLLIFAVFSNYFPALLRLGWTMSENIWLSCCDWDLLRMDWIESWCLLELEIILIIEVVLLVIMLDLRLLQGSMVRVLRGHTSSRSGRYRVTG